MKVRLFFGAILLLGLNGCAGGSSGQAPTLKASDWDNVSAGGVDGGGGVGVVCPSSAGETFELLDLHEARKEGLVFSHNPQNQEEAIDLAARLFANHFWNPDTIDLPDYIQLLKERAIRIVFEGGKLGDDEGEVKFGSALSLSSDVGQYNIDPNCMLEQIAYFDDKTNILKIHQANWDRLTWLDKAALVTHEIIYLMERKDSLESFASGGKKVTSKNVRFFVGHLFSKDGVTPRAHSLPDKSKLFLCRSKYVDGKEDQSTYFYFHNDGLNKVSTVYNLVYGLSSHYQLKAIFPDINVKDFLNQTKGEFDIITPLGFTDHFVAPRFFIHIKKVKGRPPVFQAFHEENGKRIPVGNKQELDCYHF